MGGMMANTTRAVAEFLRGAMTAQGLSQLALAKKSGVAQSHISRLLMLLVTLSAGTAHATDWRYFGHDLKESVETLTFFDGESVSHPTKNATRVWVKSIRASELARYVNAHEKAVARESIRRMNAGQVPMFLSLPGFKPANKDEVLTAVALITSDEVVASAPDIQPVSKLLFEIDCIGKRIKLLDGFVYNDRGLVLNAKQGAFRSIAPDTNEEWLSLLTCPTK
jgi:hypothetical protein